MSCPLLIDKEETIFVVDLRDLGWDSSNWTQILQQYPYGLKFDQSPDDELAKLYQNITLLSGTSLVYLRRIGFPSPQLVLRSIIFSWKSQKRPPNWNERCR